MGEVIHKLEAFRAASCTLPIPLTTGTQPSGVRRRQLIKLAANGFEVLEECGIVGLPLLGVGRAQDGGGVDGCGHALSHGVPEKPAALLQQLVLLANHGASRSCAEADYELGLDARQFSLKPRLAGVYFRLGGSFVDATLATVVEFEMFDGVGDVDFRTVDTGFFESSVQ